MPLSIDLRKISEITTSDRTFLSIYLSSPKSVKNLEKELQRKRKALRGSDELKEEQQHFDENVKIIFDYLDKNPFKSGSLCILSGWISDFFEAIPLGVPVHDTIWIDSSPYIRPLAELQDEYEGVAVVVVDNKKARIYTLAASVKSEEKNILGDIKNHVRKGGWSQQRYERRRDKQLLHYSRDIAQALIGVYKQKEFRRIILVGGKEILKILQENLPMSMQDLISTKAIDLSKGVEFINKEVLDIFTEMERQSECDLWEHISSEYLRGGIGVVGLDEVFTAAKHGRVEHAIVNRNYHPIGIRCRECEALELVKVNECLVCGSNSLFEVDMVNEITEILKQTSAEIDFADEIPSLTESGNIAALLRF